MRVDTRDGKYRSKDAFIDGHSARDRHRGFIVEDNGLENSSCTDVLSTGTRNSWLKRITHGKTGKIEETRNVSNKYI